MHLLIVIVLVVALVGAARGASKAVARSYRRRMDAWGKAHPDASRIAQRAAALGQMAATLRYGGPAIKHGWLYGWRDGWATGKAWADKHRPVPPELDPQPEPEPQPVAETAERPPAEPTPLRDRAVRRDGRPRLRAVPTPDDRARPVQWLAWTEGPNTESESPNKQPASTGRNPDMPIETVTGGEVHTPEQLAAELDAI